MKATPPADIPVLSRREFVCASFLAASGVALGLNAAESDKQARPRPIIGFSKPFQSMGAVDMAAFVEEVGWSGIECPVRSQGQIEPKGWARSSPDWRRRFEGGVLIFP